MRPLWWVPCSYSTLGYFEGVMVAVPMADRCCLLAHQSCDLQMAVFDVEVSVYVRTRSEGRPSSFRA